MNARRPAWTLSEAAERTGVSRSTLRRYREGGKFPNAYKAIDGQWKIPMEDLLAAGLRVSDPALGAPAEQAVPPAQSMPTEQPNGQAQPAQDATVERVRELESLLAVERARVEGLERLAAAAEANTADLRMALRVLESGRPTPVSEPAHEQPTEHAQPVRKRRWPWSS